MQKLPYFTAELPGIVSDELELEMDQLLATQDDGRLYIAESGAITFTVHAVLRSAAARALAKHPALVGLSHDLLGPDVNFYWDQGVYKKPEKPRRFPWHRRALHSRRIPARSCVRASDGIRSHVHEWSRSCGRCSMARRFPRQAPRS
jgi:hypothetical protein